MTELLRELEAVVALQVARILAMGVNIPPARRAAESAALRFVVTRHADIAEAVKDAAYGRALIDAMNCEYQAAKESRKGGKQEAWITTYILLRRIKVAADHLIDDAHNSAREAGE